MNQINRNDRHAADILRVRPELDGPLRRFRAEVYGEYARQLDPARAAWLFQDAAGPDREMPLWVCRKGEAIVGQQAAIVTPIKLPDGTAEGGWGIDFMIHPEWRLKGIAPALLDGFVQSVELSLGVGVSEMAFRTLMRLGWRDLGRMDTLVRPLDLRRVLSWRGHDRGFAAVLSQAGTPFLHGGASLGGAWARLRGYRLEAIPAFDARADEVWRRVSPSLAVLAVRDQARLAWRFDRGPDASTYQRFYLVRRRETRGYVVIRAGQLLGASTGFIVDHLARTADLAPLLALATREISRLGMAAAVHDGRDPRGYEALHALGYLRVRRAADKRFVARVDPAREGALAAALEPNNWFVTRADSDWDHPGV